MHKSSCRLVVGGFSNFLPALDLLPLFMYYELCNGQDSIIRCKLLCPSHLRWVYGPQVSQGGQTSLCWALYGGISSRSHVFTISTLFNKHSTLQHCSVCNISMILLYNAISGSMKSLSIRLMSAF